MKKQTTRVQIELPEASMERLRALKERTEAGSYADVVRSAFLLYEKLLNLSDEGKKILLEDVHSGAQQELLLITPGA